MDGSLDLNLAKLNKKIWLVKVPNHVAAAWRPLVEAAMNPDEQNLEDDSQPKLGTVRIELGAEEEEAAERFKMTLSVPDPSGGAPREFKLRQLAPNSSGQVLAMSYKTQGPNGPTDAAAGLSVEGVVTASYNAMPSFASEDKVDHSYAAVNKARTLQASTRTRTVRTYEDTRENNLSRLQNSRAMAMDLKRRAEEARRSREDSKRVRADVDVLERQLFGLFERQAHWAMNKLVEETRQPAAHLKAVLEKIAVFNKRGPHRDTYQLKKEYTHSTEPEAPAG